MAELDVIALEEEIRQLELADEERCKILGLEDRTEDDLQGIEDYDPE